MRANDRGEERSEGRLRDRARLVRTRCWMHDVVRARPVGPGDGGRKALARELTVCEPAAWEPGHTAEDGLQASPVCVVEQEKVTSWANSCCTTPHENLPASSRSASRRIFPGT